MKSELVKLRKLLHKEMVNIFVQCERDHLPIQDGLEAIAALRHLHEATCRELDYADLEDGLHSYALDLLHGLDHLVDNPAFGQPARQAARHCRELLFKLHPPGGAA